VPHEGWEEEILLPGCPEPALREAVKSAVEQGILWLRRGPSSVWKEEVPVGVMDDLDTGRLHPPPEPLAPQELSASELPSAWNEGSTNGFALAQAASQSRGVTLPWPLVRDGIQRAVGSQWLELEPDSGPVDCDYSEAGRILLTLPGEDAPPPVPLPSAAAVELEADQIVDLADYMPELQLKGAGFNLRFRVEVVLDDGLPAAAREEVDQLLQEISAELKSR